MFTTEYREQGRLFVVLMNTVAFAEDGGKTRMTLNSRVTFADPAAADSLAGMEQGWTQQLEKLDLEVVFASSGDVRKLAVAAPATSPVILMTRMLDAPRALVWKCLTEKDRFARWWGPRGYTNTITDFDIRVGGKWRVVQKDPDGNRIHLFRLLPRDREAGTARQQLCHGEHVRWQGDDRDAHSGGDPAAKPDIHTYTVCQSFEDSDGMVASGMEWGAAESMDQLAEQLEELRKEEMK